ncbi:hypothetical protein VTN77DRAFT_9224 [Rasamsonia byssochlamydoides]|uniref:uncharacterized protein n=1 Tax=Rasamsonia byssochlamydoides TaxID=89139 RepID=UPI003743AAB4
MALDGAPTDIDPDVFSECASSIEAEYMQKMYLAAFPDEQIPELLPAGAFPSHGIPSAGISYANPETIPELQRLIRTTLPDHCHRPVGPAAAASSCNPPIDIQYLILDYLPGINIPKILTIQQRSYWRHRVQLLQNIIPETKCFDAERAVVDVDWQFLCLQVERLLG